MTTSPEGRPEGMAAPETVERIAAQVLNDVMKAERLGDNMDPIIAAALRAYGDRRGEEERAKALGRVGALEKLLGEAAAELESEAQNYEDEARFGRRHYQPHGKSLLAVATRARKLLAAAPSGDAKGTK